MMPDSIADFLNDQTCATICCIDAAGNPYCFNCFYAFNRENNLLYFKSPRETCHAGLLAINPAIAGTVLPDKLNKAATKGVQLKGKILDGMHPMTKDAYTAYHKKYPAALMITGQVFVVKLDAIKMKDSKLGLGKKMLWKRDSSFI
ncbi:MAG: pyridoxamine 5'-phosphate oxidase family protein [Bacteroidetes bacterium]|nr:pyridoxamine 5'-phosphate oxidase family protein [Bacteroidota bacterium]